MSYVHTFGLHKPAGPVVTRHICGGAGRAVTSLSLLYTIWKKYGEKLGLGEKPSDEDSKAMVDDTLELLVGKLRRHLNWYMCLMSYELIKIDPKDDKNKEKKEEEGEQ